MTIVQYLVLLSSLFLIAGMHKGESKPWQFVALAGMYFALAVVASCL